MKTLILLLTSVVVIFTDGLSQFVWDIDRVGNSYHVRNKLTFHNIDLQLSKLIIILPLAQTNQYQEVSNLNSYLGIPVNIPETDDKYLRWTFTGELPGPGQSKEIFYDFDVKPVPVNFDFAQVTTIYPYNTSSHNYLWYTGTSGEYVDPWNATIQNIGNGLWSQAEDIIDYARKCYEFVAQNYQYLTANTGLHTVAEILAEGGGDCGNLSSIFVSLLRYKSIPSRHVVTIRPDGTFHVWADFYLENYGWIPVDVTYKNSNPNGDYFGKYDGNGIVLNKEVWLLMDRGDGYTYYYPLLQTFNFWYWYTSGGNNYNIVHQLTSTFFSGMDELESQEDISLFPNPVSDRLMLPNWEPGSVVSVYDVIGRLISRTRLNEHFIDVGKLINGMYFIRVSHGNKAGSASFIKK